MIDHVTFGVKNLEKSRDFYEKAFTPIGWKVSFGEDGIFHAFDIGKGFLFEIAKHQGSALITSVHIAFRVESEKMVQEFYRAAIGAGAMDNGKPGPRADYTENYYASFVLDPDGHNIEAMFDVWT